ncbi:unnamed protein product [Discula destructiva]
MQSADDEYLDQDSRYGEQAGYYPATDYALPYLSKWSRVVDHPTVSAMLAHMNCSYLGQPGMPPTLLSLKRHAQSLALLIQYLEPSVTTGAVDGMVLGDHDPHGYVFNDGVDGSGLRERTYVDSGARRLNNANAFDWLHDLHNPYHNDDPIHHRPLNSLMNEVQSAHDLTGTHFHCPLTDIVPRGRKEDFDKNDIFLSETDAKARHYASHNNLVRHANECLELLDHEFSATGGLLSIIPPDGAGLNAADFEAAKNSLLGQLLLHTQGMYLRMHEFELDVGNMRDALAKDAIVPLQSLRANGPDKASGRELVVDQDRFVIVNAGNDTWKYMQDDFDAAERQAQEKARVYREAGASGERQWLKDRGGNEYARGITTVDYTTRYYRLAGAGHSTIFVAPAFGRLPSTAQTPQNERNQGVLAMVQPRWPERVSEWERKYKKQIADATALQRAKFELERQNNDQKEVIDSLQHTVDALRHVQTATEEALQAAQAEVAPGGAAAAPIPTAPVATLTAQIQALSSQLAATQRAQGQASQDACAAAVAEAQQRADDLAKRNNDLRQFFTQLQETVGAQNITDAALLQVIKSARDSRFTATPSSAKPTGP